MSFTPSVVLCTTIVTLFLFASTETRAADWVNMSIEELMNTDVTAVSSSEQSFSDTAAAVFIITREAIRRSGATEIPEILRMVPGVQVGRISASKWAVGVRGFNSRFTDNLLVMIDHQVVYTPAFSGTHWEIHDLVLEDIERIEVVRGPGASVWGTNAVNGVISILTRSAEQTQNGLLSLSGGNEAQIAALRYGGELPQGGHYRAYLKHSNRDAQADTDGHNAEDDWNITRGGFRADWHSWHNDRVTLMANAYRADIRQNYTLPDDSGRVTQRDLNTGEAYGASFQGRWQHDLSLSSQITTQVYYQHFRRRDTLQNETRDTLDLDFRHEWAFRQNHQLIWGAGYRVGRDRGGETPLITFDPKAITLHLFSAFAQDRVQLFNNTLEFTLGSRIQYHTFDHWSIQPTVRLLWKPFPDHRLWAAFSRSTQTPARNKRDIAWRPTRLSGILPIFRINPNPDLDADRVFTFEAGYRTWALDHWLVGLAVYYANYRNFPLLQIHQLDLPSQSLLLNWDNTGKAQALGLEFATEWNPVESLTFHLAYHLIHYRVRSRNNLFSTLGTERSIYPTGEIAPKQQASLRLSWDIRPELELDLWFRYVDSITVGTQLPGFVKNIKSYSSINARLAWKPSKNLELALTGQNLNQPRHTEFLEEIGTFPEQIERSVSGQIRWDF